MDELSFYWKITTGMRKLKEHTERIIHPFCSAHDLTFMQFRILLTLHFEGPQTVSGLARSACMADTNNSALCKKMAQRGLLLRHRDTKDERQVLVSLSPEGKQLVNAFIRESSARCGMLTARFSGQDAECIAAGFDRLITILHDEEKETAS